MPKAEEERALLRERVWLGPRSTALLDEEQSAKAAAYIAAYFSAVQTSRFADALAEVDGKRLAAFPCRFPGEG
jgi:hypothetical protein